MTPSTPRFAESVLESFGAAPEFRDAVIGDLAQEFALRVESHGERAARRWYYREALRAAPHLARNWLKRAEFRDARRLLNVVGLSFVLTFMVENLAFFAGAAIWISGREMLGVPSEPPRTAVLMMAVVLAWMLPVCAGYLAASFAREAPMIAATAAGMTWATFVTVTAVIQVLIAHPPVERAWVPLTMRIASLTLVLFGSVAGGLLWQWRHARGSGEVASV